jgi:hypothetical protein
MLREIFQIRNGLASYRLIGTQERKEYNQQEQLCVTYRKRIGLQKY